MIDEKKISEAINRLNIYKDEREVSPFGDSIRILIDLAEQVLSDGYVKREDVEELVRVLGLANSMIKYLSQGNCPQGCSQGTIQESEDNIYQCQWCDELSQIKSALNKFKGGNDE